MCDKLLHKYIIELCCWYPLGYMKASAVVTKFVLAHNAGQGVWSTLDDIVT